MIIIKIYKKYEKKSEKLLLVFTKYVRIYFDLLDTLLFLFRIKTVNFRANRGSFLE